MTGTDIEKVVKDETAPTPSVKQRHTSRHRHTHAIDTFLNKVISRKLLMMVTGTGLFCFGLIDQPTWLHLAWVYFGVQGIIDTTKAFKGSDS